MGLSAWKQYGSSRWSLRCNPSSGNLHPTECYPILLGISGMADGLYHYRVDTHQLELRCRYARPIETSTPVLLLGLSSLQWREAWKYGERAYRYCQLDIGHAVAAISYSAAALGYRVTPLLEVGSDNLDALLGLNRREAFYDDETESSDLLLALHLPQECVHAPIEQLLQASAAGEWHGKANRVDARHHYEWPIMAETTAATRCPAGSVEQYKAEVWPSPLPAAEHPLSQQSATRLIQQRRSAQAFDPNGQITLNDFYRLLDRLLPRPDLAPWSSLPMRTRLHLLLYVHAVDGLAPGLYLLARSRSGVDELKTQLRRDLLWESVDSAPSHLPLFKLAGARARNAAMKLSCQQAIAGDSAFALSMLAEFEQCITTAPWQYNRLMWEAGMAGHVLYLEAEAIGLRGTGIGCFFDDGVHDMLGIAGSSLQTLYHFTVGTPLNDARLVTLPPYSRESG